MPGEEHILWRLWHAVGRAEFWVEAGERLLLVLALFLLAKILLALARLIIRGAARTRLRDQRVTTLAIMVQSLVRYVVIFAAVLVGLYILGVPTAHLLAGLGIGGLAFALGVQNLVSDLLSGVAFLLEDTMAVGDRVVIYPNQIRGEVMEMGARVVKLRGAEGELHQIAYSSIQSVTNLTHKGKPAT